MSDLSRFRDHARKMAATPDATPHPAAPSQQERQLWTRLADEVDRHLANDPSVILGPTDDDQPLDLAYLEVPC